ncbi:MAG TPA: zinc-dependent metalloprotease [Burkholderiaceae bacterium]|nr:zinc-dependent metalloprotease [Burkholderiaceae bacterium]
MRKLVIAAGVHRVAERRQRGAAASLILVLAALAGCAAAVSLEPGAAVASPVTTTPGAQSPAQSPAQAPAQSPAQAPAQAPAEAAPQPGVDAEARGPREAPRRAASREARDFDDVVADAKSQDGYFTIWRRDGRVWLEVREDQFDVPFFLSIAYDSGVGGNGLYPGVLAANHVVVLHRLANQVQLVSRNLSARATPDTPLALAIRDSFSDSLVASAPLASAINPERDSYLVDAAVLFGGDVADLQPVFDGVFHVPYAFDARNSGFERVHTDEHATRLVLRAHYAVARLPPWAAGQPGSPQPPRDLPDPRSLLMDLSFVMSPMPATPMPARYADPRVGYFTVDFTDFARPGGSTERTHLIKRWRLEKKDPGAALSAPREPIVVWLDRNIPDKWRGAVRAGVAEWNKAFERAGFLGALDIRDVAADADASAMDGTRHILVRWFAVHGVAAQATTRLLTDPRSGEILQASALVSDNWTRVDRTAITEYLPGPDAGDRHAGDPQPAPPRSAGDADDCRYQDGAESLNGFALDLLEARGVIAPDGPEADRFIAAGIRDAVMHEIGHALGLRHNFRASATVPLDRLRDPDFVRREGISSSVMDYNPLNVPLEGEPPTEYHQVTLGAYDYWAIEYGYRPFAPQDEAAGIAQIAARSAEDARLAYGTDEDAGVGASGIDPLINRYDLGDDPLAYAKRTFVLARELWRRSEQRLPWPGESYAINRRNLVRGLDEIGTVAPLIAKYIGGIYTSRALVGSGAAGPGVPPLRPVPVEKQREALDVLAGDLFSIDSFRFDPEFVQRLGIDYLDRAGPDPAAGRVDFNLPEALLAIQRGVLDTLMSDATAARLAALEPMLADPTAQLTLAELHSRLAAAIWGDLKGANHVDSTRRALQREHLQRILATLVRAPSAGTADTRAVERQVAERLADQLHRALANPRLDDLTRAHFEECQERVVEALRATISKQGP